MNPNDNDDMCDDCYQSVATSVASTTFTSTDEWTSATEEVHIKPMEQRDYARIQYYRDLIQQQITDYQRLRNEEALYEEELVTTKEFSKTLDQRLEHVWADAQEAIEENEQFRKTYNKLMAQEDAKVQQTANFLKDTLPIRDELFDTLCVTSHTEKQAVGNAVELQMDYRSRLKELLQTRTRLQQKVRTFRQQFEQSQEQKKSAYDELVVRLEEIDRLDSELQLLRINKLKIT